MMYDMVSEIMSNRNLTTYDKAERLLYLHKLLIAYNPVDPDILMLEDELIAMGFCPECGGYLEVYKYNDVHVDEFQEESYNIICSRCGKEVE